MARLVLPLTAGALFAVLGIVRATGHVELYDSIVSAWGVAPFDFPFVDIHGVLSSVQCWGEGVNVYVSNPCDVLGRVFFYSPLLLWLAPTGLGVSATPYAGLLVDGLFIASLALLPLPRKSAEFAILLMALLSTTTVFAVERANIDLLIFALAALAVTMPGRVRYALIGIAGLVKFYPAVMFVLALGERPRRFCWIAGLAALVGGVFLAFYRPELSLALANVPQGRYFTDLFGAVNLPYGLAALGLPVSPAALELVLAPAAFAAAVALAPRVAWPRLAEREALCLAAGAALMTGCFFAGQSIGYRGVFLLLAMPGLLALGRSSRVFAVTALLAVFLMWSELFRHAIDSAWPGAAFAFWLGRELAWWWVMAALGGALLAFARTTPLGRAVESLARPIRLA